jgi:phosphoserine phosphatase
MKIYLIRHGESEWNRTSRFTGRQDVRLSALGQEQARRVARRLEKVSLTAIYTSPLQRARETANAIGKLKRLPVQLCDGLAEIHHGLWEGLTVEQVTEQFPKELENWRRTPHAVKMPAGESIGQAAERAGAALNELVRAHDQGALVICSHEVILQVIVLQALDLPLEHYGKWCFENAALSLLEREARGSFRLAFLNDTSHLEGVRSDHARQAL